MEIRTLLTFARIAETGSFSKTAEQLGYSQSAITMQIKQLEGELNAPLFERIGKQVKLTRAGERLLPYALEMFAVLQKAENIAREPEEITGQLRVGTSESFVISVLPPVFAALQEVCPFVEIGVQTALVPDLFQKLRQNEVDLLFFLDKKVYFPEWVKVLEHPEDIYFVASAHSELACRKHIPIERLLEGPLYLTEKGISYRYAVEQALAEKGLALHPFCPASLSGDRKYGCDYEVFIAESGDFLFAGIRCAGLSGQWRTHNPGCGISQDHNVESACLSSQQVRDASDEGVYGFFDSTFGTGLESCANCRSTYLFGQNHP